MAIRRRTVLWLVLGAFVLMFVGAVGWGIGVPTLRERARLSRMADDELFASPPAGFTPDGDKWKRAGDWDLYGDWNGGEIFQNYVTSESAATGADAWVAHLESSGWSVRTLRCPTDSRPNAELTATKEMGGFQAWANVYVGVTPERSQLRVESPDDGGTTWNLPELAPPPAGC